MKEIDNTTETAEYLNSVDSTLRYWRHRGFGPTSFKVGRRVMYRKVDVDAWLAAQYDATARGESTASESA